VPLFPQFLQNVPRKLKPSKQVFSGAGNRLRALDLPKRAAKGRIGAFFLFPIFFTRSVHNKHVVDLFFVADKYLMSDLKVCF
jgi:hypothetical protein